MSKADEMFKELGYEKIENKIQITYVKPCENIQFLLNVKKIEYHFLRGSTFLIQTMQQLQAINEKVKELRMDIEEAKDILLNVVADEVVGAYCIEIQKETDCAKNCENDDCFIIRAIETVLKELELKDKVIDEMSKSFVTHMIGIAQEYSVDANFLEKEKLIEYFTNKVKLQSNKQSQ